MLLLAAAPEKLLGFSSFDFSQFPDAPVPADLARLPRLGRLAGHASTLSLETLLALEPDLVVDCGNVDDSWVSQAQRVSERSKIPWVLIGGNLASSAQQLLTIGDIVGTEARTRRQAALAQIFIADAQAFSSGSRARTRFYAARGAKGLETGLAGSLHTEAAELLGLENVARVAGRSGLTQVSLENLLAWQPDIILTQNVTTRNYILRILHGRESAPLRNGRCYCLMVCRLAGWMRHRALTVLPGCAGFMPGSTHGSRLRCRMI
jgi:iron complex transport system substrate-binding protein